MQRYRAFTPGMQVRGQMIRAATQCLNQEHFEPYLRQNGLLGRQGDLQPILADRWYSQQDWLNTLAALIDASDSTAMFDLISVGMKIAEILTNEAGFCDLSLEEKLDAWERIYQEQHRDGEAGQITIQRVSDRSIRVESHTAYPDDILYGVLYFIASHHFPAAAVSVRYDDTLQRCDKGGEITRYTLAWG